MLLKYRNVIYSISFMDLFAVGLISPLLGNYLKSLGASHLLIGILSSTYSGIQVISGPIIGSWSDISDRKIVLKVTVLLCAILYLCLGIVNTVVAIFAIRILLGCFKHTQVLCKAMISDLFPPQEQAEMLSHSQILGTIGFTVGPMIGGYVSELPNGFMYICTCTCILFIVNLFLSSLLPSFKSLKTVQKHSSNKLKNQETHAPQKAILKIGSNIKEIDWAHNWYLFLLRFLCAISTAFYYYNEGFYLREYFNISQSIMGYFMSFRALVQTFIIFFTGNLKNIFYKNDTNCLRRVFHFFILMTFSSFLFVIANDFKLYVICIIPFVISTAVLRISTMELLLGECEKDQVGAFSGVSNSIMSVARFVTPVVSGLISDTLNSKVTMMISFLPALAGTILSMRMIKNSEIVKEKTT